MAYNKTITTSTTVGAIFTWYDFLVFNIAVALIFPRMFFPDMGALPPILAFAVGFLARPLGSVVFGSFGDRFGRKATLIGTLLLTGTSTVLIGLLPTHEQIGIAATVLLIMLRILQTIAVGGEWAAASVLLAEHNSQSRNKSFITSFITSSFAIASLMASLMFFLVMLPGEEFFENIGWRIPFLISLVLLGVGVYMRRKMTETPEFQALIDQKTTNPRPLKTLLVKHHKVLLLSALAIALAPTWSYTIMVFGSSFMLQSGLISRPDLTQAQLIAWTALAVVYAFAGWLGDRIDRYRLAMISAISSLVLCLPVFALLQHGQALWALLALCLLTFNLSLAPLMFSELYPADIRQTGAGVSYNLGLAMSGFMVVIAQQIFNQTQNINNVAGVFLVLTLMSILSLMYLSRRCRARPV